MENWKTSDWVEAVYKVFDWGKFPLDPKGETMVKLLTMLRACSKTPEEAIDFICDLEHQIERYAQRRSRQSLIFAARCRSLN